MELALFLALIIPIAMLSIAAKAQSSAEVCGLLWEPFYIERLSPKQDTPTYQSCLKVYDRIPNKQAFQYALKYFVHNLGGLADPTCSAGARGGWQTNGIQNQCVIMLNDVKQKWQNSGSRYTGYYIDLCKGFVRPVYVNRGKGNGYRDKPNQHTTLIGAFLTNNVVSEFKPLKDSAGYATIKRKWGTIAKVDLIGLHSTNSVTSSSKPIHVSPHQSSWGCPSIAPENVWLIKKLAEDGPSLVVNYAGPSLNPLESVRNCSVITDNQTRMVDATPPVTRTKRAKSARRTGRG